MQKSCTRVFATHNALVRHKVHKAQKRTPCADMEKAVKVYAVDDNRASSLQPSRIVEFPLSGTMITHDTHNTHDTTPNPWAYIRRKFGVNRIFHAFFAIFGPNFRRIYAQKTSNTHILRLPPTTFCVEYKFFCVNLRLNCVSLTLWSIKHILLLYA